MYTSSFLHLVVWHVYVQYIIFFVFHIRWSSQQNTAERNRAAPTGRRWQADNLDTFSEFTSPSFASTLYIYIYSIYNYIYMHTYIHDTHILKQFLPLFSFRRKTRGLFRRNLVSVRPCRTCVPREMRRRWRRSWRGWMTRWPRWPEGCPRDAPGMAALNFGH